MSQSKNTRNTNLATRSYPTTYTSSTSTGLKFTTKSNTRKTTKLQRMTSTLYCTKRGMNGKSFTYKTTVITSQLTMSTRNLTCRRLNRHKVVLTPEKKSEITKSYESDLAREKAPPIYHKILTARLTAMQTTKPPQMMNVKK